ncbi:MAG: histidine kinase, partial [Comamonadaceae bacterium]
MSTASTAENRAERDGEEDIIPSRGYEMLPIVALGGSAGAIPALQAFFGAMPPGSGLAYVVVLHLSPDHASALSDVLARATSMQVIEVTTPVKVEPDTIYVIPPGRVLRSADGHIVLEAMPPGRVRHVAVDMFFRTLADTHGPHAAAIVLSGMDGDGAAGIKRVKEHGGLTIAQNPEECEHDSMPRAAFATGLVDWVLPVREMPARVAAYFGLEKSLQLPPEEPPPLARDEAQEAALRDVLLFLRTRTGRNFFPYKRATIVRRIARRMQICGTESLPAYVTVLRTVPGEAGALLQDLLISVTSFFRDPEAFEALAHEIPRMFEGKQAGDAVRVWVTACATGEE